MLEGNKPRPDLHQYGDRYVNCKRCGCSIPAAHAKEIIFNDEFGGQALIVCKDDKWCESLGPKAAK